MNVEIVTNHLPHLCKAIDVMVDVETLSLRGDACIIQIGAVAFDPMAPVDEDEVAVISTFKINIDPDSDYQGRQDQDTIGWWNSQLSKNPDLEEMIFSDQYRLMEALLKYSGWLGTINPRYQWSNGPYFDGRVLEEAYLRCGLQNPFKHYEQRDMKTILGLIDPGMVREWRASKIEGVANKHDALYDCRSQVYAVQQAFAMIKDYGLKTYD